MLMAVACLVVGSGPLAAQAAAPAVRETEPVPPAAAFTSATSSSLRDGVDRYVVDRATLLRRHDAPYSAPRRERMRSFYSGWQARLGELAYQSLDVEARIDHALLRNEIAYQVSLLDREERSAVEMAALLPFADVMGSLLEARRDLEPVDGRVTAATLAALAAQVETARQAVEAGADAASSSVRRPAAGSAPTILTTPILAFRAARVVADLRTTLQGWYRFYAGYDPLFTWWSSEPYGRLDAGLEAYARTLRERVAGIHPDEQEPIIGDPIGSAGLEADLRYEMIPYTAAELVRIADREFAWTEAELRRAAGEMGHGDDWKAALEAVKARHVEPGRQTELTRDLALEAIAFVEARDLLTIPPLAKEVWRMEMLSPEQQRTSPFYLGGEVVRVAFPTDAMTHEDKLMAMRGNNVHFSRAVVHHELIPGHHLQQYMTARYNAHRRVFSTPFWTEGWALYWEMLLWDLGFPQTPEDRMGMLFWRLHRAARIVFSLNVHLGAMTPDEAIDFLVERVGHERANAAAEVRRSLIGTYPPLYQAAYMLGGLQFRALRRELVESGRMTDREFHDGVLQGGNMPVAMVRARLLGEAPDRESAPSWRFADD